MASRFSRKHTQKIHEDDQVVVRNIPNRYSLYADLDRFWDQVEERFSCEIYASKLIDSQQENTLAYIGIKNVSQDLIESLNRRCPKFNNNILKFKRTAKRTRTRTTKHASTRASTRAGIGTNPRARYVRTKVGRTAGANRKARGPCRSPHSSSRRTDGSGRDPPTRTNTRDQRNTRKRESCRKSNKRDRRSGRDHKRTSGRPDRAGDSYISTHGGTNTITNSKRVRNRHTGGDGVRSGRYNRLPVVGRNVERTKPARTNTTIHPSART